MVDREDAEDVMCGSSRRLTHWGKRRERERKSLFGIDQLIHFALVNDLASSP